MDCVWHLHLKYADGGSDCKTYIGHNEREVALEAEEDAADREGRKIVSHKFIACVQDTAHNQTHS